MPHPFPHRPTPVMEHALTRLRAAAVPVLAAALLAVVALVPAPAAAQSTVPEPARDSTARDSTARGATERADTFELPAVVVTATRVPLDRKALPTPVSVLTGSELRDQGVATVAEALRQVPGAAVVSSGGTGAQTSLFLRGGESDYVKVLIDGVPVNDPGGAFDFAALSTDQVERIEVVRGPVSVLYGSDAVSGVVHIFTRRGRGAPTVSAEITGGSGRQSHDGDRYATYDAEAAVSGAAGPVSYTVGGGRRFSEGRYPMNNARALHTGTLRLGWTGAGAEVGFTSRLSDGRSHFPTDGAGNLVDENAYLDRRLWSSALEGGIRLGQADARLQVGIVTRSQTAVDDPDGPADTLGVYASTLSFDGTRYLADARVNARVAGGVVTAGVAWETAEAATRYRSRSAFGPLNADGDFDRTTTGYYLQLLTRPIPPLHLMAGGRIDDSDTFGSFGTYRLGATLEITETTRLRGAIGRGFREPTFAESFGSGFGDVGSATLAPELSRSWEAGLEREIGPATVAATWFHQRFEDLIQYTYAPPTDGGPNYFNVGAARSRGLELEARAAGGRWSGAASYTYLQTEVLDPGLAADATFVEGEDLLRRPAHTGSLTTRYALDRGVLSLVLNATGERTDVDYGAGFPAPRITLPAFATLNLAVEHALPVAPDADLLLRVDNLLDAEHQVIAGFPGPGRLLRIGVRLGR